jgi:hypothetical protein
MVIVQRRMRHTFGLPRNGHIGWTRRHVPLSIALFTLRFFLVDQSHMMPRAPGRSPSLYIPHASPVQSLSLLLSVS